MNQIPVPTTSIRPGFASLPIPSMPFVFPKKIRIQGKSFIPKDEFHVTLVGPGHGLVEKLAARRGIPREEAECLSLKMLESAARDVSFSIMLRHRYRLASKVYPGNKVFARRSIIVDCFVGGAFEFYRRLELFSDILIKEVPHHITLFTASHKKSLPGIGIYTMEDLAKHTREIPDEGFLGLAPANAA